MIIGLALAALMIIFGSQQNDLMILKMKNPVNKVVVDQDRKAAIHVEIKAVKKMHKSYAKESKHFRKRTENLLIEQSTEKEDFDKLFDDMVDYEVKINKEFIPHRMQIQDILTQEEWKDVLLLAKKDYEKQQKSNQKALRKLDSQLEKMTSKIVDHFEEAESREKAGNLLKEFSDDVNYFALQIVEYDQFEEDILLNKNATSEELSSVVDHSNQHWVGMLEALSTLHAGLASIAMDDEWKFLGKQMRKLI